MCAAHQLSAILAQSSVTSKPQWAMARGLASKGHGITRDTEEENSGD